MLNSKMTSSHVPAYVSIYNSLYLDIVNGVYAPGDYLPGETVLAEKYNVSRNTLRQALAVLNEDGLITKSRGKGTLVQRHSSEDANKNNENPMLSFARTPVEDIQLQYNYAPPTDIAIHKLKLTRSEIVLASDIVYCSQDKPIGYSFIQVPVKVISDLGVDVSVKDAIYDLLTHTLYTNAARQELSIKLVHANESEAEFLQVPEESPLLLIESILYQLSHDALARCKFYFRPEYYKIDYTVA